MQTNKCNKKDLFENLKKHANNIIYYKKNSCALERKYYHYPKIKYVKKFKKDLNLSRATKLESDWSHFSAIYSHDIWDTEFFKRYQKYVQKLKLNNHFEFHRFMRNFIDFCFYKEITLKKLEKITDDFFKILKSEPVTCSLKNFSSGFSPKRNYKINDSLTIKKPQRQDFFIEKIRASEEFDYSDLIDNGSCVIEHTFLQKDIGDHDSNIMIQLQTILSIFKLVKFQSMCTLTTTFDPFGMGVSDRMPIYTRGIREITTVFSKKDVCKLKETISFLSKNYERHELNPINYGDNGLGIALRTYNETLNNLGYFHSEITPYAVKTINGLLVPDVDDSRERFVRRTSNFLYYLGVRNNHTEEILKSAYTWRNHYFHGRSTTSIKKKLENKGITSKYIELFMLNSARLLLFTLLILKKNNGKELMRLLDDVNTVDGIKKLQRELNKTKKYFSVYKNGIKIKETNTLDVEILEC